MLDRRFLGLCGYLGGVILLLTLAVHYGKANGATFADTVGRPACPCVDCDCGKHKEQIALLEARIASLEASLREHLGDHASVETSPPVARVAAPATTRKEVRRYPGSPWTWPGDLRTHLIAKHGMGSDQLSGLSHGELKTIHDNLHNRQRTGLMIYSAPSHGESTSVSSPSRTVKPTPMYFVPSSYCPSGTCPR